MARGRRQGARVRPALRLSASEFTCLRQLVRRYLWALLDAWIGTYTDGVGSWLEAIRAGDSKVRRVPLKSGIGVNWGPTLIAVGEGAVWALAGPELFEIDPQTLDVLHRLDLSAERPGVVAVGAGAVWTTGGIGGLGNSVTKIDPRTDRIIRTFPPLGNRTRVTCAIAATPSAVWVTLGNTACDTIGSSAVCDELAEWPRALFPARTETPSLPCPRVVDTRIRAVSRRLQLRPGCHTGCPA